MSVIAATDPAAVPALGPQAAVARIAELRQLLAQAGCASGTGAANGGAGVAGVTDPTDPAQSIDAGARYLKAQLDAFGGDSSLALAAYNAGPGGVPPYAETQAYVQRGLGYANAYRSALA